MDTTLYRDVFSWPTEDVLKPGSEALLNDLQINLVDDNIKDVLLAMVKEAKNEDRDESFALFDMGCVVKRYRLWKEMFPTIRPYYAIKAYDDPAVIKLLSLLGAGFDCASRNEIQLAMKVGVRSEDIIFANTVKIPSHISHAAKSGIDLMTFDSHEELVKIKKHCPNARLLLRICPIINDPSQVEISLEAFGCSLEVVPDILQTAKAHHLNVVGVAFHAGCSTRSAEVYVEQIKQARRVFSIAEAHDIHMKILDIGGGFLGKKGIEDRLPEIAAGINTCIMEYFPPGSGVTVMAEPGRYFIDSGLTLATSVIGKRRRFKVKKMEIEYHLSESVFGITCHNFLPGHRGYQYNPCVAQLDDKEETCSSDTEQEKVIVRGASLHPHDFHTLYKLPELEVGDWLLFENMGAYTVTRSSAFNGLPKAPIRRVMERDIWESLEGKD